VSRVHEIYNGLEALGCYNVQVGDRGLLRCLLHLAVERLEIAAAPEQDVLMCLEDLALYHDTHVTQHTVLPLLIELSKQVPVMGRDFHIFLSVVHLEVLLLPLL
jgi:hypothetical protein